ncbi:Uncharacterised protein [Mycobacterium tuberculosis]|nr:Uncharacterised protein [Mycobacterium tuberculosis]
MSATIPRPAVAALDDAPRALLDNALQHLREAGRCAALAFRASDDHQASCMAVHGDILAAARRVASLIDRLDGFSDSAAHC